MIHNYITHRKQPTNTGEPLLKSLAMFCYLKDVCVMCGTRIAWQICFIVMFQASQNLFLKLQYLQLLYLSLQSCPPRGTSIWGIQLHLRINSDIILLSAMELTPPIFSKSFSKQQNKQKHLYNGGFFWCWVFFLQHI